jgi:ABC-type nitrate/sulfonate/bicarbonate transport system substrate-binding protein
MARHHCSAPELKNDPPALAVAVADAWLDAQGYGRAHPADHRRFLEEGTGALGTGVESLTVIFQGFAGEVSSYLGAIT